MQPKSTITVSIENGIVNVDGVPPGVVVEVRRYDVDPIDAVWAKYDEIYGKPYYETLYVSTGQLTQPTPPAAQAQIDAAAAKGGE